MLANVQQATIKPIITDAVAPGGLIHTDDYDIDARLPAWGYPHKTDRSILASSSSCITLPPR